MAFKSFMTSKMLLFIVNSFDFIVNLNIFLLFDDNAALLTGLLAGCFRGLLLVMPRLLLLMPRLLLLVVDGIGG